MVNQNTNNISREVYDIVYRAKKFATMAHGNQLYGGEFPYVMHLQATEGVLLRFGIFDDDLRTAAWLHDVLEDTDVSYETIVEMFGRNIADIVAAVTEPKGGNRKWRHAQTYPRIAKNYKAVIVKLADRIANIEAGGKVDMYRKEQGDFKVAMLSNVESFDTDQCLMIDEMLNYIESMLVEA